MIMSDASSNPSLSLVQDFYRTIDGQQWRKQKTLVSDDFVAILGSSMKLSFDAWQERLKTFYDGFPDGQHQIEFFTVEGNRILSVGRFAGSHQQEFMGQASTGKIIEMGVMHLDRVVNNKIVEHIAAADLLGLLRQIQAK